MKKYFVCVYILSELYKFYAFTAVEKHNPWVLNYLKENRPMYM